MLTTRITRLLNIKHPILQGALSGLGTWDFAAAVSNAGGLGCFTAAVARTPERLRRQIRSLRQELKGKPFSVNISLFMCPHQNEMIKIAVEEGAPVVETSVYAVPDEWVDLMKDNNITWLHKVTTLRHALHAEKQGADAIIIIGLEGFGFKNPRQLPTIAMVPWIKSNLRVPVIAGGGVGDPHTFLAALALGAEAAYIGSAFLTTEEAPLPREIKEKLINIRPDDPSIIYRILAPTNQEDFKEVMKLRGRVPMEKWSR